MTSTDWDYGGVCDSPCLVGGFQATLALGHEVVLLVSSLALVYLFAVLLCVIYHLAWHVWHTLVLLCSSNFSVLGPHVMHLLLLSVVCGSA